MGEFLAAVELREPPRGGIDQGQALYRGQLRFTPSTATAASVAVRDNARAARRLHARLLAVTERGGGQLQRPRRGIGGRLLDDSLRWARESGLHKVDLGVWPHNAAAIALYRSRGFTIEGRLRRHYRRANGELWDVITMGLVLDTQSPGSSYPDAENL